MKYLLIVLAFCFGTAFAQVAISPACAPTVAIGGGMLGDCSNPPADPRMVAIRAFWDANSLKPQTIFAAMQQYGVSVDDLEDALDYRVNVIHYLRSNNAPDGLGGVKIWPAASINKVLAFYGAAASSWTSLVAQDILDRSANRVALYTSRGWLHPDSIDPWEHAPPVPIAPQPIQACVGSVCVAVGP